MKMNSKEIHEWLHGLPDPFKDILPYKARNGVYFQVGTFKRLTCDRGFMLFRNGYLGNKTYYPILELDIENTPTISMRVEDYTKQTLEKFSKVIEDVVVERAIWNIKSFK